MSARPRSTSPTVRIDCFEADATLSTVSPDLFDGSPSLRAHRRDCDPSHVPLAVLARERAERLAIYKLAASGSMVRGMWRGYAAFPDGK